MTNPLVEEGALAPVTKAGDTACPLRASVTGLTALLNQRKRGD